MRVILGLVLFFLSLTVSAQNTQQCQQKQTTESQMEYKFHDQNIVVLGWAHPLPVDKTAATRAFAQALVQADSSHCADAEKTLQKYLASHVSRATESQRIETALENLYRQYNFKILGVESSEQEFDQAYFQRSTGQNKIYDFAEKMNLTCPNVAKISDDFLKVLPGPEVFFAKNNSQVTFKPMEDFDLRKEAMQGVSKDTLDFKLNKEHLSPPAQSLMKDLMKRLAQGEVFTDDEAAAVVAAEKNPDKQDKLRRVLKETKSLLKNLEERNQAIASSAVKEKKDMVILVGSTHVKGITTALDDLCRQQQIQSLRSPSSVSKALK